MIRELILYLRTKSSKEARVFGHLYESISLIEREKRCHKYWTPHRTQCKNFILNAAASIKEHDTLLILGSGPLHEIPLEELANIYKRIDLVDIVHLNETKNKYKHLKNVCFIEADITQLESVLRKEKKIFNIIPSQFLTENYNLVISANLLSQLSYHLRNYLEKKGPGYTSLELDNFCYQVSFDHYRYLAKFPCPAVLITDTESHFIGKNDELIEIQTPFISFPLPTPNEEWWWNLAPRPEYSKNFSVKMKVAAFVLNF